MLTAFHTFRKHVIMADKSIIIPVCDQIRVKGELWVFSHYPKWVTCLEYFKILKYVEIWRRPGSQRQKHIPLLFFPQDMEAPKLDPQSHRVKDHGCLYSPLIHAALSDQAAAGMHKPLFPPPTSMFYPRRTPPAPRNSCVSWGKPPRGPVTNH